MNIVIGSGTSADGVLVGNQLGITPGLPAGSPLTPQFVAPISFYYKSARRVPYFVTQELQLVSKPGSKFSWIVGGYLQDSKDSYVPLGLFYGYGDPALAEIARYQTTLALAGFAQGT